jgi:hypothetical protein
LLASLGGYICSTGKNELRIHLFVNSHLETSLGSVKLSVEQKTQYPWQDRVVIILKPEKPARFAVSLRIPGWCTKAQMKVNGKPVSVRKSLRKGYARVNRLWRDGDVIELRLPMRVERMEAHPKVRQDAGRVAIMRGPVVYCLEEVDNGKDLNCIELAADPEFTVGYDRKLNLPVITGTAVRTLTRGWGRRLYRPLSAPARKVVTVKAMPYFAWANRRTGEMLVWVRQLR